MWNIFTSLARISRVRWRIIRKLGRYFLTILNFLQHDFILIFPNMRCLLTEYFHFARLSSDFHCFLWRLFPTLDSFAQKCSNFHSICQVLTSNLAQARRFMRLFTRTSDKELMKTLEREFSTTAKLSKGCAHDAISLHWVTLTTKRRSERGEIGSGVADDNSAELFYFSTFLPVHQTPRLVVIIIIVVCWTTNIHRKNFRLLIFREFNLLLKVERGVHLPTLSLLCTQSSGIMLGIFVDFLLTRWHCATIENAFRTH